MKKIFSLLLLFTVVTMSAQEAPTSFPRKYLIEHFTGDQCGNCPAGMYSIVTYTQATATPCIWVSHHYGYNEDEYTIAESKKIATLVGVQGAPSMAMNRTKVTGTDIAFHPLELADNAVVKSIAAKCDTTAEASVVINHTYNVETRELNLTVSGQVANPTTTEYLLTILIKENGLIGKQADYYYSWKTAGYKEFLHPCVARDVITDSQLGDTVKVENQAYSKTLTYTVSKDWVAENCCIVAYITSLDKKPVINAEEAPLVAGTTGGVEYLPMGITEMKEPNNVTKLAFDTLELEKIADDKLAIALMAEGKTRSEFYGEMRLVVYLEFNTLDSILPTDSLLFADGHELNTFSTGQVDLATRIFSGSRMAYFEMPLLNRLCHIWRIKSGAMVVDENGGFVVKGKLDNGKNFIITCNMPTAVDNVVFDQAHVEKIMREGQFIIRIDGVEYDIQGRVIRQ
jgi:hypothetical protein